MLGLGGAGVDEVGIVVILHRLDMADTDADQAEFCCADLAREQVAACGENPRGKLRRMAERARPRADLEIRALELERHCRAGKAMGLEPRGDTFGQRPEIALQRTEAADIALEGRFRRD